MQHLVLLMVKNFIVFKYDASYIIQSNVHVMSTYINYIKYEQMNYVV